MDTGKRISHNFFLIYLCVIALTAVIALSLRGWAYYRTPLDQRPFRDDYQSMRPSGTYSQGLGIIGSTMVTIGVVIYSSRKRIRALWNLGALSRWLEIHIVLCLIGPILVVYHTTFKAGGIAAISLWSMLSVAASGIIGRFLYVQIPHNIRGKELSTEELDEELRGMREKLLVTTEGTAAIALIDAAFRNVQTPARLSDAVSSVLALRRLQKRTMAQVSALLGRSSLTSHTLREIRANASARITLLRKTIVLRQVERLFFYWHAIHLPFTVIMFITLAAHVTVAYLLGYRWIF